MNVTEFKIQDLQHMILISVPVCVTELYHLLASFIKVQ